MTLQLRLAGLYLLLAAPVLIIFGAAVYLISQARLHDSVDQGLETRARAIESALQSSSSPGRLTSTDIELARRSLDRLALQGSAFAVLDRSGGILFRSGSQGLDAASDVQTGRFGVRTVEARDQRFRMLVRPLNSLGEPVGYVETQDDMDFVDASLRDIRSILIGGGFIVLLGTALPAYLLAGRALDPVRRVSSLAREIERTADFSRRLDVGAPRGEMQELTQTFNRMIDRVERMMLAQRAFLADSSHELRRPLTVLRTNIDVINDPGLSEADRRQVEAEMRAEAESMSNLVANLVLLSRQGDLALDLSPISLSVLCEGCAAAMRPVFPSHRLLTEIAPDVWMLADPERLSQVFANLLENAATYSPEGGIVLLTLCVEEDDAVIEVTDYGTGMTAADVEHAFDRFYRGSSAREQKSDGFGLGLAIVRHVVEAHGGEVSLRSRPGEGTTVRFVLKTTAASALQASNSAQ